MITLHADAVLAVFDGFTGKPATAGGLRFEVDGIAFRPQYREGGYFVFINLEAGRRRITINSSFFETETIDITADGHGREERYVNLRPNALYPFGRDVTGLVVRVGKKGVPDPGVTVHVASAAHEIRLAQDMSEKGVTEARLYVRGGISLPAAYLLSDGKKAEVCVLQEFIDGLGRFAAPTMHEHKRGTALYPCRAFLTGKDGSFKAYFKEPGPIELLVGEKPGLMRLTLSSGENAIDIDR